MADEQLQGNQVQPAQESPRTRPNTPDPVWHLLFDRLDAQDANIERAVSNTVVIANEQERLREHVNEEQEKFSELLASKVGRGEVLNDLWNAFKKSRPAQLIAAAIVTSMAPVVVANWGTLVENIRSVF